MSNENEDLISSLYPPPPPFYEFFTPENVELIENLKNKEEEEEIKGELKFLVPPKQPAGEQYRGYGNVWSFIDKLPDLKETQWKQLYPDTEPGEEDNKIEQLHKLLNSLLLKFFELISILTINPTEYTNKIEDLNVILININHLLNTYRPHQSRESLIMLLKKQISIKQQEIQTINNKNNEIKEKLKNLVNLDEIEMEEEEEVDEKETIKNEIIDKLLINI
ncbi:unnamed protein product [Candida verbasci]|uniref:Mediator of RNA polymerase II transcription subunit 7 n=1 Tax=Candida verbasci TaxID=1227364 RepID=A0A9W4TWU9_9ASCO|nr:unnamed protein product [Candida verbasci]